MVPSMRLINKSELPTFVNPHLGVVNAGQILALAPHPPNKLRLVLAPDLAIEVDSDWAWTRQPQPGDYFVAVIGKPSVAVRSAVFETSFQSVTLPTHTGDPDPDLH